MADSAVSSGPTDDQFFILINGTDALQPDVRIRQPVVRFHFVGKSLKILD
jgi:hypothetical protein